MIYSQTFYQILYFSSWKENSGKKKFLKILNISDENIIKCWTGPGTNIWREGMPNLSSECSSLENSI
jgi:hypothetical protein